MHAQILVMYYLDDDSFKHYFGDEITALRMLKELGALRKMQVCVCGSEMKVVMREKKRVFRCGKNNCKAEVSLRYGSVFFDSGKGCKQIMRIARCWLKRESSDEAVKSTPFNPDTISLWYTRFNQLVMKSVSSKRKKIGAPGMVVELDEMRLGHKKYERGHRVDGAWVLNGVERSAEKRKFSVVVLAQNAETLHRVISENVEEGSIVFTDGWKGYKGIESACGVSHETVNHKRYFKDPVTGVCTNTVEGVNGALKATVPIRHRTEESAPLMCALYIWRDENLSRLCDAFIDLLREYVEENKE